LIDPALGPYLFDTSSQSWLERSTDLAVRQWLADYLRQHRMRVSAITVMERIRGYAMLLDRAAPKHHEHITLERKGFLDSLGPVHPVDASVAVFAAELAALLPQPPAAKALPPDRRVASGQAVPLAL
jgi:hypothetical protein